LPPPLEERLRNAGVNPAELALSDEDLKRHHRDPAQSLRRAGKTFARLGEAFAAEPFLPRLDAGVWFSGEGSKSETSGPKRNDRA
jgi:hypothetical protein